MELSPQHSLGWEDEEEEEDGEPLFADDLEDDDEPPPLPAPMPSLSQLSQQPGGGARGGGPSRTPLTQGVRGGGGGGGAVMADWGGPPSAAGDGNQGNDDQETQKKRAPILTLTIERIFSEKGLSRIEKEFPKLKFQGKGHEVSDLACLMQQYEHWANALYPKMTFRDVTDRIEKLATKKEFKSKMIQMRRKWVQKPTPLSPPVIDGDDDITDKNNHHGNSSSQTNHRRRRSGSSFSGGEDELEIVYNNEEGRPPTNGIINEEEVSERVSGTTDRDRGREGEMESVSDKEDMIEEEEVEKERDTLVANDELPSRKRARSPSQDRGGGVIPRVEESERERERLALGPSDQDDENEIDDLLMEEDQFIQEMSSQQIPPGFD